MGLFNYFSKKFSGKSSDHYKKAAIDVTEAGFALGEAVKDITLAGGNLAGVGLQAGTAFAAYKVVAGEIIAQNAGWQTAAKVAGYIAPGALTTTCLKVAAEVLKFIATQLVANPLAILGGTIATVIAMNPEHAKETIKHTGMAAFELGKAGAKIVDAGLEVVAADLLLVTEIAQGINDYAQGIVLGSQVDVLGDDYALDVEFA